MGRKFVTIEICSKRYKVLEDDLRIMYYKEKKTLPPVPAYEKHLIRKTKCKIGKKSSI